MMFRQIAKHFGIGLATVLPFAFVIWVVIFVFDQVDGLFGQYVDRIQGVYVPGVGFVLVVAAITLVGALTRIYVSRRILMWIDGIFTRIPFIKSLYTTVKELIQNILTRHRGFQRAVLVEWPDERAFVLGFVTNEKLPPELDPDGTRIAVYLSNSFQFAGMTVIVERSRVRDCSLTVEEALKFAVSAGLGRSAEESSLVPHRHNFNSEVVMTSSGGEQGRPFSD